MSDEPVMERLHPLTMVTGLGAVIKSVWGAIAAAAFLLYSGRTYIALAIIGFAFVSGFLAPILRWLSFSWRVDDDEVLMNSGIVNRNHRSIPFDRIQDVNIEQNPLHRAFGLARVKLETGASAGKGEEDGIIDSIPLDRANALRDRVRAHRAGVTNPLAASGGAEAEVLDDAEERAPVFAMDQRRVLLAGIFNFSLAVVGAVFGLMQTMGDVANLNFFSRQFWLEQFDVSNPLISYIVAHQIVAIFAGVISLIFIGLATGVVRTVLRDWNFRLDRTQTGFRRRRGLLTLTDTVLPSKRVQAAVFINGPVKRRFGWTSLKLQSLAQDSGGSGDHVVAPLARPVEGDEILGAMDWRSLPPIDDSWDRPSPALVMMSLIWFIPIFIIGIAAGLLLTPWAFIASGVMALLSVLTLLDWRWRRHRVDGDRFLIRSGWWRRRLVILPLAKVQSIDLKRNFIDRWFGVASIKLGVAGGGGFAAHGVEAVPARAAMDLRDQLLADVR
ncbi:PH domain-containing protein [Sphingomicrobium flavum]|uniref:PH domain-containing protein n=1 Tax=Sphingomicrobium flavum TaxID=1229164 RepID=UPI0021AD586D|nr:PH domain-containing protein [Sphingomicrobium flavum]